MSSRSRPQRSKFERNGHIVQEPQDDHSSEWDDALCTPKFSFPVAAGIVFCLAVACFANSHDGDFVFDDSEAIVGNKDLLPETPISLVFSHDFWGQKLDSKTSHKSYRPLTVMTYRWNYAFVGDLDPWGFHVVNIALHGMVCVVFLAVFSVLLAGYREVPDSDRPVFGCPRAAFLCSVMFAVHPIHTESVAGIVGRADLLCALTFGLSFLLYAKSCFSSTSSRSHRPETFHKLTFAASMLLCSVSTFCKEQGITVIGVCSVFDVISVCWVDPLVLVGLGKQNKSEDNSRNGIEFANNKKGKSLSPWMRSLVARHLLLLVTGLLLLFVRWRVMGSTIPVFQVHDNPHSFVNGTLYRVLNYNYLYAINAWLLLSPWWLCFDWSMGCIPVITSLSDPRILTVLAFWFLIGALVFHCMSGCFTKDRRILILSLSVLVIPYLPAANLFFRVGFVIAERILYVSTAGFCLLVVLGARTISLGSHSSVKQVMAAGFTLLMLIFIFKSVQRSNEWRQEMTLFTSGAQVCPLNAKVHYNIGKLNGDNDNMDFAVEEYRLAIKLNPLYDQAMNNLANILKDNGDILEAEELLTKAVTVRAEFAAAWMNLGIVQADLKKNESAEKSYFEALRHRRKYPDCYYNLGNLYLQMGRHSEAIRAWVNATTQKPTHVNAWTNSLILLDNLGKFEEAAVVGQEALKVLKDDPQILYNLANIYGKMDKYAKSEKYFLAAIKNQQHNSKFHLNLGVLYHRWGKLDKAEEAYTVAKHLAPQDPSVHEYLQMLHKKMGQQQ